MGRELAICHAGGLDIGAELVRAGLATRYRDEPRHLVEEAEARAAGRLWIRFSGRGDPLVTLSPAVWLDAVATAASGRWAT